MLFPQEAAKGIIPVDNHHRIGGSSQGLLQPAKNIRRVSIAQHGVPGQIADHHIVGLQSRKVQGGNQLIQLNHRRILGRVVEDVYRIQQTPGYACMVVGAPIIKGYRLSLLAEDRRNECGNGGLPVGSCHHNGQLGLGHILQEAPIEPHGCHARFIIAHMSRVTVPK